MRPLKGENGSPSKPQQPKRESENSTELIQRLQKQQEELQAANEELATTEEELRAQNEELIASREELERGRERYRDLFETAPDGYVVTDSQGLIQQCNQAATQMLGYTANDLIQRRISFFLFASGIEEYVKHRSSLTAHGSSLPRWEVVMQPAGKSPFWAAITASVSRNEHGKTTGIRWLIHDITERKRMEEETARLASFPVRNPTPIIEADLDGKALYVNPAAQKLFPDLQDRSPDHPFLADWESAKNACCDDTNSIQREILANERWYLQSIHFIKEARRLRIYGLDITERKRAEEGLRERERLLQTVIDGSTSPIFLKDLDGKFITINAALERMLGTSREEIRGKTDYDIASMEAADYWRTHDKQVMATRRAIQIEEVADLQDGHHIFLANKFPLVDLAGQIYGVGAISHDITERKRAEDALRQLNEQLEERVAERTAELTKSAQKVKAERQRFNEMLGNMPVYVVLLSPDYYVPFANRFFEERFGKSNGKRCFEYLFGRTEPCTNCETFKVLKTNAPHRWEWLGPDGRNYDIYDFPFTDADGSRLIMEVGLDITARKKAAAEVLAERQRLFAVLETVPAMFCLLTPDYHVAFANKSFREQFGESNGRHCYEYCFGYSQPCGFCESYNVLKTGKPHRWEVKGPHGRLIEAYDFPFSDVDGSPLILEMDIDITEQRRTETALRESSVYNRTLIEASLDPLVTIGPDGRITDVNAATERATGCNRQKLVGTDFSEYFTEPDRARAGYQQVFREGTVRDYLLEIRHRNGHIMPVLYNATVYRNDEGGVVGVFAAARDITERKRAENELLQAHQDLAMRANQLRALAGELTLSEQRERTRLAKVLHDHLQQLLVAAKFRLAMLGRRGDEVERQATKEIEDLINDSIAASRSLTAELSPPILHDAGLKAGLEWLARRMADTQGLLVDLELEEIGLLPEDLKILLFESVRELLFNVVKHARTRSASVNLRHVNGSLQLTVSDQGAGFNPKTIAKAGESGGGFGLFGIRERIELVGGALEIESSPGNGSRVILTVPVAETTAAAPQEIPQSAVGLDNLQSAHRDLRKKIRVLIADDHAIILNGLAKVLGDEPDIEIVGRAADGQKAVELATKLIPDVILMDVAMPKLTGVEATRAIISERPDIRIIGLSMFEEAERRQAMLDAGAVAYVAKSGPSAELINTIRKSMVGAS